MTICVVFLCCLTNLTYFSNYYSAFQFNFIQTDANYCTFSKGMDDEICPYATFHLLGFREEMDPNKTGNQFQTFPHPNGQPPQQDMAHHRQASQSMVTILILSIDFRFVFNRKNCIYSLVLEIE